MGRDVRTTVCIPSPRSRPTLQGVTSATGGRRIVHFVFGLRDQDEPFHLVHYLSIASAIAVVQPAEVFVHCDKLPYGIYWDLIRPHVSLHRVQPADAVEAFPYEDTLVQSSVHAHHADIIRLDVLLEYGGLYADIDTLWVTRPPEACWVAEAAIGREVDVFDERIGRARPSLSNALLFSQRGSAFLRSWRGRIEAALDGSWSAHSCLLADDLATESPTAVHVEPQRTFHHFPPSREGLHDLLVGQVEDLDGVAAVHLCAHLWWSEQRRDLSDVHALQIDEAWVRTSPSTYAQLARPFLPEHGLF